MSQNITSFLLSFLSMLAWLLLPTAKADMRWEKHPGSGLYEAYHEGKLCIHVYKVEAGGVNYRQHRAFHAPEIQSMLEKNAILMGYKESNEINPKLAPHLLGFTFYSFRGDKLGSYVPYSLNELKLRLSKALEFNQLIYEVATDKKLAPHQKLTKLNDAWQLDYRSTYEKDIIYHDTFNRLGAEIGALEKNKKNYFYRYYHRLLQIDKIRMDLYACGNNPSAILSKADEWYNKIKNKETKKGLLCICMLMQLELAKKPADLKKIKDLFTKYQQIAPDKKNAQENIDKQCMALNNANQLLLQKDLLIGKKKPQLLLPEIGNFTEHYRNRIINNEKAKHSVADGMVKRQWKISLAFFNGHLPKHEGDTVLATESLRKLGIEFPPKSWAIYTHSREELVVCNTRENIKKLIRLITKHIRK